MIRAASMCSGIGAPETALPDWDWAWCAEIEPFPSRVLAARFPHSPNLGDLTAHDFAARATACGPIDLVIAGTPCQAFSVAGLRGGLSDARGNLTLRALQIYEELCDAARSSGSPEPIYWWENVPGVLNHPDNPFGCLLGGLAGSASALIPPGGCEWSNAGVVAGPARTVAWRVLDAQYFGVAQRRERVFVVAGSRNGFDPAKVFLERKSLRRDPAPGREAGTVVAALTSTGVGTCGPDDNQAQAGHLLAYGGGNCSGPVDVAACLTAKGQRQDFEVETFVTHALTGEGFDASEDGTGRGTPLVPVALGFDCKASGQNGFGVGEVASTMRSMGHANSHQNGGGHLAVAVAIRGREDGAQIEIGDDKAFALRASQGGSDKPHVLTHAVRRLVPTECERLQGFPDGHTDVPNGNKPAADGPRYKGLGNSMAVPVIRWIGLRIERQIEGVAA